MIELQLLLSWNTVLHNLLYLITHNTISGVEIGVLSANFFQKTVKIDKPFLFFVRDRRSETLLFVGSIKNPISA